MTIKAVLFDIGGVCCGSPITGAQNYDKLYNLPTNYINVAITAQGPQGAFQRLEKGELELEEFYIQFGKELSNANLAGEAYGRYCKKMGVEIPKLPIGFVVNGKELWSMMMEEALSIDDLVINAIIRLKLSGKYQVAALTNNFHVPGAPKPTAIKITGPITAARIREASIAARGGGGAGAGTEILKSLFDYYVESAIEGRRKPDPEFYKIALRKLNVKAEEVVFLDDIGINLIAAKKLGINTIRVHPGKSRQAIEELEEMVGVALLTGREAKL